MYLPSHGTQQWEMNVVWEQEQSKIKIDKKILYYATDKMSVLTF